LRGHARNIKVHQVGSLILKPPMPTQSRGHATQRFHASSMAPSSLTAATAATTAATAAHVVRDRRLWRNNRHPGRVSVRVRLNTRLAKELSAAPKHKDEAGITAGAAIAVVRCRTSQTMSLQALIHGSSHPVAIFGSLPLGPSRTTGRAGRAGRGGPFGHFVDDRLDRLWRYHHRFLGIGPTNDRTEHHR
jgi:hypothetical protein